MALTQGKELNARVSSLFDIPEKKLTAIGSSITSFACDPRHFGEEGGRPSKKVGIVL